MTRDRLLQKQAELTQQREQVVMQVAAYDGALQLIAQLLAEQDGDGQDESE